MRTDARVDGAAHRRRAVPRLVLPAVLLAMLAPQAVAQPAGDDFLNGSGRAEARLFRIGPSAARLSLAPTVGVALADFLNTLGRGESLVVDWVALEGSIPEQMRDAAPSVRADSTDRDAGTTKVRKSPATPNSMPVAVAAAEQRAQAGPAPAGEAAFEVGPFAIPGLLETAGSRASTNARVVPGRAREARGVSEISTVSIAGGIVELRGLRWEARQRTGEGATASGTFTVQAVRVNGLALPVPEEGAPLDAVLGPVNDVLAPTGLVVRAPAVRTAAGVVRVTPMTVAVADPAAGRAFVAPLLGALQPVRQPVTDELIERSDGELSAAILVADILVGVLSGASSFHAELGGASAFTEGVRFASPFGPALAPAPPSVETVTVHGAIARSDAGDDVATGPQTITRTRVERVPVASAATPGTRAGVAGMLLALVGVLVTLLAAGSDWVRMRTAKVREAT